MEKTKKQQTTKDTLLQEYFDYTLSPGGHIDKPLDKFKEYIKQETSPDAEVALAMHALQALKLDYVEHCFDKRCHTAAPLFNHLENTSDWEYIDFHFLLAALGYHRDIDKTLTLFQKALDTIESKYKNDFDFTELCAKLHFKFTQRLILFACSNRKNHERIINMSHVETPFRHSYNIAVNSVENTQEMHLLNIRLGLLESNIELIKHSFPILQEQNWQLYDKAKREIYDYLHGTSGVIGEDIFGHDLGSYMIGYQFRKRRLTLGKEIPELANETKISEEALEEIDCGEHPDNFALARRLHAVAPYFGVSFDYFLGDESKTIENSEYFVLEMSAFMLEEENESHYIRLGGNAEIKDKEE